MTDKVGGWREGEGGGGEGGGGEGEGEHSPVCSTTNKVGGGCATTGHGNTVHTQDTCTHHTPITSHTSKYVQLPVHTS